jgi:hypothetical protein
MASSSLDRNAESICELGAFIGLILLPPSDRIIMRKMVGRRNL